MEMTKTIMMMRSMDEGSEQRRFMFKLERGEFRYEIGSPSQKDSYGLANGGSIMSDFIKNFRQD